MAKQAAIPETGRQLRLYPLDAAATFPEGAVVVLVGGEVEEGGADPAVILGFAQHAAGDYVEASKGLVALATAEATFWVEGDRAPAAADIGAEYGFAVDGDGDWYLDTTEVVNTRAVVQDIDETRSLFLIRVLAANRQLG